MVGQEDDPASYWVKRSLFRFFFVKLRGCKSLAPLQYLTGFVGSSPQMCHSRVQIPYIGDKRDLLPLMTGILI